MINILLVDDEEDVALLLKEGIQIYGKYNVDVYIDPLLALHNFQPHNYDLILVDIIMPKMNGLDFYRLLTEMDKECNVCFFTASETNEKEIKDLFPDLKERKTVLIQKPIKLKVLLPLIMEIIDETHSR